MSILHSRAHWVASLAALFVAAASQASAVPVASLAVEVRTANAVYGGTDNDVHLVLLVQDGAGAPQERRWNLDSGIDDFERGNQDTYGLTTNLPSDTCNIIGISIQKSPDDWDGGWKLDWFRVIVNGTEFYRGNVDAWLEDDHRDWWAANFVPTSCGGFFFGGTGSPPPPLPNCTVNVGSVEFPSPEPDADCDGKPNKSDTEFNPPDRDGDGLPDRTEDWNGNGVVDPGETDPDKPNTPADLADGDADGIPDIFEDRDRDGVKDPAETAANNPDTDGDGWFDGPRNVRTRLFLVHVHCKDSSEDTELGDDELFVTFNHARWPQDQDLDGSWELGDDDSVSPMLEAARRTRGITPVGPLRVRVDLREDDIFDWTDDDFEVDHDHAFPETGLTQWAFVDDGWFNDIEYELRFVSVTQLFADPAPLAAGNDGDGDGIPESLESTMAVSMMGVADPAQPDIYMELDVLGADQMPERYSREDIASRFTQRSFAFHLDDGTFGGGQILPYQENFTLAQARTQRAMNLAPARLATFHYAVGVDVVKDNEGNSWNGRAFRVVKTPSGAWISLAGNNGNTLVWKTDYLDHLTDFESIVWLHEFGHNLGLCHRPGDSEAQSLGAGGSNVCTVGNSGGNCNCGHYTVSSSSDTAMGNTKGFLFYEALDRETDYDPAEWPAIDIRQIGRP
jgi:hypothetical protein